MNLIVILNTTGLAEITAAVRTAKVTVWLTPTGSWKPANKNLRKATAMRNFSFDIDLKPAAATWLTIDLTQPEKDMPPPGYSAWYAALYLGDKSPCILRWERGNWRNVEGKVMPIPMHVIRLAALPPIKKVKDDVRTTSKKAKAVDPNPVEATVSDSGSV